MDVIGITRTFNLDDIETKFLSSLKDSDFDNGDYFVNCIDSEPLSGITDLEEMHVIGQCSSFAAFGEMDIKV